MNDKEQFIGYLKYSGKSVKEGYMDAKKSADALLGFDEALRFFLSEQDLRLRGADFEIPVLVKKGSFEINIPEIIDTLISLKGILATSGSIYLAATAKKAAEGGIMSTGVAKDTKALFRSALKSLQWVLKIAAHVGTMSKKNFDKAKVEQNQKGAMISIPNEKGENLTVPKEYFELYLRCPDKLFSKSAGVIEKERILEVGVFEDGLENKVSVTEKEKIIFYSVSDESRDVLFPELKHGMNIELEGEITRGNERSNTIGFEYKKHVLTCKPEQGNIATFKNKIISRLKDHFFPPVKIIGVVYREYESKLKQDRPSIIFNDIVPLENSEDEHKLF